MYIPIIKVGESIEKTVVSDASYLFAGQIPLTVMKLFKVENPTIMNHMFFQNDANPEVDMTQLDIVPNADAVTLSNMFYKCDAIEKIVLTPSLKASSALSMFQNCASLTTLELNGLDVSSCADFRSFLYGCKALTEFDGSMLPNLSVTNNNCQNFFAFTTAMRKVWIPKEWKCPATTATTSLFISNGGSNLNSTIREIYTDAVSEADQISKGMWSNFTLAYNSSGAKIPDSQIHYGVSHDDYLNA